MKLNYFSLGLKKTLNVSDNSLICNSTFCQKNTISTIFLSTHTNKKYLACVWSTEYKIKAILNKSTVIFYYNVNSEFT